MHRRMKVYKRNKTDGFGDRWFFRCGWCALTTDKGWNGIYSAYSYEQINIFLGIHINMHKREHPFKYWWWQFSRRWN